MAKESIKMKSIPLITQQLTPDMPKMYGSINLADESYEKLCSVISTYIEHEGHAPVVGLSYAFNTSTKELISCNLLFGPDDIPY